MSPTVHRERGFRFFFFSREEERPHIHVTCEQGEAKIWLEPGVELFKNYGLPDRELRAVIEIAQERRNEFLYAWRRYFGG